MTGGSSTDFRRLPVLTRLDTPEQRGGQPVVGEAARYRLDPCRTPSVERAWRPAWQSVPGSEAKWVDQSRRRKYLEIESQFHIEPRRA